MGGGLPRAHRRSSTSRRLAQERRAHAGLRGGRRGGRRARGCSRSGRGARHAAGTGPEPEARGSAPDRPRGGAGEAGPGLIQPMNLHRKPKENNSLKRESPRRKLSPEELVSLTPDAAETNRKQHDSHRTLNSSCPLPEKVCLT